MRAVDGKTQLITIFSIKQNKLNYNPMSENSTKAKPD